MITPEIENIAATLVQDLDQDVAFVLTPTEILYSRKSLYSRSPQSALTQLIQAVYEVYSDQALSVLRKRIYSTTLPSPFSWGMLKVSARKLTAPVLPKNHSQAVLLPLKELKPTKRAFERQPLEEESSAPEKDFMALAVRLAARVDRSRPRHESDRPVAAVLVSPERKILAWGVNSGSVNKTFHAEVNAITRYFETHSERIPAGSVLYSTLKPCRMCAGLLWEAWEDPTKIQVVYKEFDPGPNARETLLNARAPDRRRIAGQDRALLELELERQ